MKKHIIPAILAGILAMQGHAQQLDTHNEKLDKVFQIATQTLYKNVKDNIIKAGGSYGGEWTRDISINTWNAANLLLPEVSEYSLWHVTTNHRTQIGHQYWDQIIWVTGAYDHYLATQDKAFLKQAYIASKNTMQKLENEVFDSEYGLFRGPSVFNDGIAGYEEPIFDPKNTSSYVLDYPNAKPIKCLSTNCIYYHAYQLMAEMADRLESPQEAETYRQQAETLKAAIRKHLFNTATCQLSYLIDGQGNTHHFQEGLGMAFAIMFGIVDSNEAKEIVDKAYVGPYGLPSVYPAFKRFSKQRPGRHNVLVWPFVNAFWADAALQTGRADKFVFELENLCNLVLDSKSCFYEIYDTYTGRVCGGWQTGHETGKDYEWDSIHDQTWSATGFLRMVFRGILGLQFTENGLQLTPNPYLMKHFGFETISDLRYQQGTLRIRRTGNGNTIKEIRINGRYAGRQTALVLAPHQRNTEIEIITGE